nr:hypothetical protein X990_4034 [Burkholderia pseudomallei MSHR4868]
MKWKIQNRLKSNGLQVQLDCGWSLNLSNDLRGTGVMANFSEIG